MQVFIIEDELLGIDRLVKLLKAIDPEITVLGHAETIKSAVWWIQHHPPPELFFMDIELADGLCFEIFKQVDVRAPVIFTTSYDEYALHAFKVISIDYLLKPVQSDELTASLTKYRRLKTQLGHNGAISLPIDELLSGMQQWQQHRDYRKRFLVKQGQKLLPVEVSDIAWFVSEGKLNFIRTWNNQRFVIDYTLEQLTALLDPAEFFRINRSYLAHVRSIRTINTYFGGRLILQLNPAAEGEEVIVSKEKATEFKHWLGK